MDELLAPDKFLVVVDDFHNAVLYAAEARKNGETLEARAWCLLTSVLKNELMQAYGECYKQATEG